MIFNMGSLCFGENSIRSNTFQVLNSLHFRINKLTCTQHRDSLKCETNREASTVVQMMRAICQKSATDNPIQCSW